MKCEKNETEIETKTSLKLKYCCMCEPTTLVYRNLSPIVRKCYTVRNTAKCVSKAVVYRAGSSRNITRILLSSCSLSITMHARPRVVEN